MSLHLGKMTRQELAQWFGVSYGSFRNKSQHYFDLLEDYCTFEVIYGGVNIIDIDIYEYDKDRNIKNEQMFMQEIQQCVDTQDGLSTIAGMARKFTSQGKFTKVNTAERSLRKTGNRLFGVTKELGSHGEKGFREYIWAIKIDDMNIYRLMTKEEEEKFDDFIEKYYSSATDKIKMLALLEDTFETTDMEKKEYLLEKKKLGLDLFGQVIKLFHAETGLLVVKCTKHELSKAHIWEG